MSAWLVSALLGGALAATVQEIRLRIARAERDRARTRIETVEHELAELTSAHQVAVAAAGIAEERSRRLVRDTTGRLERCRETIDALPETDATRVMVRAQLAHVFDRLRGESEAARATTDPEPAASVPR